MNKAEFLAELSDRLKKLPEYEINKTVSFYSESIDDRMEEGLPEVEAVADLGDVHKIADEILIETPLTALIQTKISNSRKNASNKTLWMVLAICGSPVWLPIAAAFAVSLFAVYLSVWAVVISLYAVEFSLALAGGLGMIGGIITIITGKGIVGLALLGIGTSAVGLFVLSIKPLCWLCKQFIAMTVLLLTKVKGLFLTKNEGE